MFFGGTAKDGFIRGQTFSHANLGIRFQVPIGYELTNKAKAVIAAGPNQTALRFDAVTQKGQPADVAAYLKSGWVNGLKSGSIRRFTVNGLSAATADAESGDWQFSVSAVKYQTRYYRFILAAPRQNPSIANTGLSITNTFRSMTSVEKAALKPLKLRVVTARSGDTIAKLASRMQGISRKVDLFKALNGLGEGDRVKTGAKVKLVSDK